MKNRIVLSVHRRQGSSTFIGRVKAAVAGMLLALTVMAVLGTALILGSVAALAIGVIFILAMGGAIALAAVRNASRPRRGPE